ncbi:FeoB-associated Cys-rich membrane protein [Streptococcus saliviloxodontae]|uniref:FeoB-associated Cys-rich membrane protein n=1 Tax=Streptococcus saliviloxodontae TaxID=1349416 RepID=UPI001960475C|nr:FeoB-associated Cys-rich membrane protein [Streptococcus saliviloxodontae]
MSTFIIFGLILVLVFISLRSFIKGKGSCGDCDCACPIKDKMSHSETNHRG